MIRGVSEQNAPYVNYAHSAFYSHTSEAIMKTRGNVHNFHYVHFDHVNKSATERRDIALVLLRVLKNNKKYFSGAFYSHTPRYSGLSFRFPTCSSS